MTDLNTTSLTGRLTADAAIKVTSGGQSIVSFTIAVNARKRAGDEWVDDPSFIDCDFWGDRAAALQPHLKKGVQIAISGSIRQERWEKDGEKRSKLKINISSVSLMGKKSDNAAADSEVKISAEPQPKRNPNNPYSAESMKRRIASDNDDDIPF